MGVLTEKETAGMPRYTILMNMNLLLETNRKS